MEFLGIGGFELAVIFILLLIVAGPKRMIAWSYTLGKYLAVLRNMWAETAAMLQKEFKEAGVDVQIPKEPPTRGSINRMITNTVTKAAAPLTEPLKEAQRQMQEPLKDVQREVQAPLTEAQQSVQEAAAVPFTGKDLTGPRVPRTLNKPVTEQTASPATPATPTTTPPIPPTNGASRYGAAIKPPPAAAPKEPPPADEGNAESGFGAWGGG